MLAAGNNSSFEFSKIPGMDEVTLPGSENTNNARVEPNSSPVKVRPDSPIEYIASPSAVQPSSVKADTPTLQKDREVPSSRVRPDKLRELTDGTDDPRGIPTSFEGEGLVGPVGNTGVYLSPLSESSTDPAFHDASTNLSEGCFSPDGSDQAWHSASSEVPTFQYENGIPKSESHSKEKKSRISLIRRDKKLRRGQKEQGYLHPGGEPRPHGGRGCRRLEEKEEQQEEAKDQQTEKQGK